MPNNRSPVLSKILGLCASSSFLGTLLVHTLVSSVGTFSYIAKVFPSSQVQQYSNSELCRLAKEITVKVFSTDRSSWGSGILVGKHGSQYSLITNGHVLEEGKQTFTIQTIDGREYQANLLVRFDHGKKTGNDLAFLQFKSSINYEIASLGQWSNSASSKVMAAGFPVNSNSLPTDADDFMCTDMGQVSYNLDRHMQNGYKLGYFLSIPTGMSGGPLLDQRGYVVGINGLGDPIFSNQDLYLYRDGERVSNSLPGTPKEVMESLAQSSWAIPSETIVYYSPKGLDLELAKNATPKASASTNKSQIAENLTVLIRSSETVRSQTGRRFTRSGVFLEKENRTYYILTTSRKFLDLTSNKYYDIVTSDRRTHQAEVFFSDENFMVLKFTSTENYQVANIGDPNTLSPGNSLQVASWNATNKEQEVSVKNVEFMGSIKSRNPFSMDELPIVFYDNIAMGLPDGGPVLDENGNVVAIHNRSPQQGEIGQGIAIDFFLKVAPEPLKNKLTTTSESSGSCDTQLFGPCSP